MTKRQKIARAAARAAALATYKAVINAPLKKIASTTTGVRRSIDLKDIAKTAAANSYNSIIRLGQYEAPPNQLEPNKIGVGAELERKLITVLGSKSPVTIWFGNHYRGLPSEGIDLDAFEADFAKLPAGMVTPTDTEYLRTEARKAFSGQVRV